MTLLELIQRFETHLAVEMKFAEPTLATYRCGLRLLLEYVNTAGLPQEVELLPRSFLTDCMVWLSGRPGAKTGYLARRQRAFVALAAFHRDLQAKHRWDLGKPLAPSILERRMAKPLLPSKHDRYRPSDLYGQSIELPTELGPGLSEFRTKASEFEAYLRDDIDASPNTIKIYRYALRLFAWFLWQQSLDITPRSVDKSLYVEFHNHCRDSRKLSRATLAHNFSGLRRFFSYLIEVRYIQLNPFTFVRSPKIRRGLPRPIPLADVERLLAAPNLSLPEERRDRIVMELLFGSGLRISEALHLKAGHLQLGEGVLGPEATVIGKGQKERKVPLSELSVGLLKDWVKEKQLQSEDFVFKSCKSTAPIYRPTSFERRFKIYLERAGLDPALTPHQLRHSFATELHAAGADIRIIQELLGHSQLSTSQIYTKVSQRSLHETHHRCHPRNRRNQGPGTTLPPRPAEVP